MEANLKITDFAFQFFAKSDFQKLSLKFLFFVFKKNKKNLMASFAARFFLNVNKLTMK